MSGLKRAAALGAVGWVVLSPAGPALTQVACAGGLQTFTPGSAPGLQTDSSQPYAWIVPNGVTSVMIRAAGAQGGGGNNGGGKGAAVEASYPVTPGERLCILVGVAGQTIGGWSSSGGGGSFVFSANSSPCLLSNAAVANLLVVAGGGGSPSINVDGLPGRATGLGAGAAGALAGSSVPGGPLGGTGGNGGAAGNGGGGGGGLLTNGANGGIADGGQALVAGAAGGQERGFTGNGGFGGGGAGGGGGGYNGGAGNSVIPAMPGGGGGSFSSVVPISALDGVRSGNGEVTLCATASPAAVPTLGEWAMIGLMGLLALCGVAVMERRRRFVA